MRLFVSQSHDPFENLAFEESLLRMRGESAFLWVNSPCVVIGRNQNPYHEANVERLESAGIALARRLSGGGAVYHDEGNLNYSVISDEPQETPTESPEWTFGRNGEAPRNGCPDLSIRKTDPVTSKNAVKASGDRHHDGNQAAAWALSALERFGVSARLNGRNDIMIGQAKVGGLAECFDGRLLQHGTLMADVDMNMLQYALRPSTLKLEKHGISSVASRVANLSDVARTISVEQLVCSFEDVLGIPAEPAYTNEAVLQRAEKLRSRTWVFGQYAEGDMEFESLVGDDLYRISLVVKRGLAESAVITTDACRPPSLTTIAKRLVGCTPAEAASLAAHLIREEQAG